MIEAIIFDMDGTLVDTEPIHTAIERRQFRLNNLDISEEEHQKYLGTASDVMWREIAERHNLAKSADQLVEENEMECMRYFSELKEIPVMPGLPEALKEFYEAGIPMSVASSSTPEIIDLILVKTDMKKYFGAIVSAQEAGKSKPEPDVFLLAAKQLGVEPTNCLVVEDSKNGIKAALSAGMKCIAYKDLNDESDADGAHGIIQHFSQLQRFL